MNIVNKNFCNFKNSIFPFLIIIYFLTNSIYSQNSENPVVEEEKKLPVIQSYYSEEMKIRIKDYIDDQVKSTGLPAVNFTAVEGSEVIIQYSKESPGYPSMAIRNFPVGSLSRQLTILAAYKLRDESKLDFESKVKDILPELVIGTDGKAGTIQVKHLMLSTTGLTRSMERIVHTPSGGTYSTSKELVSHFKELNYPGAPGVYYVESNLNYIILGEVISRVSGMRFEKYITDTILIPAGMFKTYYESFRYVSEGVPIYDYFFSTRAKVSPVDSPPSFKAANRLYSNESDIANYLSLQLKFKEKEIYSHITIGELQTPKVYLKDEKNIQYGGGWFSKDYAGMKVFYMFPRGRGVSGGIFLIPSKNIGFSLFSNIDAYPLNEEFTKGILAILTGVKPDNLSVANSKIITLLSFAIILASVFLIIGGVYRIDRFFSMLPSEFPDYEGLNKNFVISLISFLFLFWFIFLAFPGSEIGSNYSSIPYSSSLFGWNTNLLYALLSGLFSAFIWVVYLGLCILRDNESKTN